jgi:hypothetical protein
MKRHPDGRWRGARRPAALSVAVVRARWVEAEVLRLKAIGLSFEQIAERLSQIGRGAAKPLTPMPAGLEFPPDYVISRQACHKAFSRAIAREPALALEELRKLDTARCEEMYASLQPAIRKGAPKAVEAGVKVLGHKARLNGYAAAPRRHEPSGEGRPLNLLQVLEALDASPREQPASEDTGRSDAIGTT